MWISMKTMMLAPMRMGIVRISFLMMYFSNAITALSGSALKIEKPAPS
jgi:hypothetical protein